MAWNTLLREKESLQRRSLREGCVNYRGRRRCKKAMAMGLFESVVQQEALESGGSCAARHRCSNFSGSSAAAVNFARQAKQSAGHSARAQGGKRHTEASTEASTEACESKEVRRQIPQPSCSTHGRCVFARSL